jgi:hypothetical protein
MEKPILNLFDIDVLDCDFVDITDESVQYNEVAFLLLSLKKYDGKCVEVKHDWEFLIWNDAGEVVDKFLLIENDEFRQKLYERYPLK